MASSSPCLRFLHPLSSCHLAHPLVPFWADQVAPALHTSVPGAPGPTPTPHTLEAGSKVYEYITTRLHCQFVTSGGKHQSNEERMVWLRPVPLPLRKQRLPDARKDVASHAKGGVGAADEGTAKKAGAGVAAQTKMAVDADRDEAGKCPERDACKSHTCELDHPPKEINGNNFTIQGLRVCLPFLHWCSIQFPSLLVPPCVIGDRQGGVG